MGAPGRCGPEGLRHRRARLGPKTPRRHRGDGDSWTKTLWEKGYLECRWALLKVDKVFKGPDWEPWAGSVPGEGARPKRSQAPGPSTNTVGPAGRLRLARPDRPGGSATPPNTGGGPGCRALCGPPPARRPRRGGPPARPARAQGRPWRRGGLATFRCAAGEARLPGPDVSSTR